jgi:hypothetical protein
VSFQYASSSQKLVDVTIAEGLLPLILRLGRPGLPSSSGVVLFVLQSSLLLNLFGDTGDGDTKLPPQVVGIEGFI